MSSENVRREESEQDLADPQHCGGVANGEHVSTNRPASHACPSSGFAPHEEEWVVAGTRRLSEMPAQGPRAATSGDARCPPADHTACVQAPPICPSLEHVPVLWWRKLRFFTSRSRSSPTARPWTFWPVRVHLHYNVRHDGPPGWFERANPFDRRPRRFARLGCRDGVGQWSLVKSRFPYQPACRQVRLQNGLPGDGASRSRRSTPAVSTARLRFIV